MTRLLELSLDDSQGHLVEPPMIDQLYYEPEVGGYVITFVPSEYCSQASTETVTVRDMSPFKQDFRRVRARLDQLTDLLTAGDPIARLVHAGGGDFTFHMQGGDVRQLSDERFDSLTTFDASHALQDLAQVAETAFRIHALTSGHE